MKRYIILFVSLGLVLALSIYFRTFTINFPQLKIQAKNILEQRINQEAVKQIGEKFPGFSSLAKDRLIKTLIYDYRRQKKREIKKQIQEEYLRLKDKYQDEKGQTYFMELDCWHWARYVDNVLRYGHPGDKIVNGKQIDVLMLAPTGAVLNWNSFLFYLSAFLYKSFCILKPIPLFTFLFYLPLFFITIFIIVLYLFCFYHWGIPSAIITCLFVSLAPTLLLRSCAGWFDWDILNLLFPLLIVWTYFTASNAASFKQRLLWICFSSFWVGLFCFTWLGWWFIFLIVVLYEIYFLLNLLFVYLQYKEKNLLLLKQHIISLFLFVFFSIFWIILFLGFEPLRLLFYQVKDALILNNPLAVSIWPNVYSTVGELRRANLLEIGDFIGGVSLFIFSVLCILIMFLRNRNYADFKYGIIAMLTIWFIVMLLACFKGIKFSNYLLIPLGVSMGSIIGDAYQYFKNKKRKLIASLVLIFAVILSVKSINGAYNTVNKIFPFVDDSFYRTLTNLKKTTDQDAVINSWWDFGDWFKVISQRRVIFDGQSQNNPRGYWMAKALISKDEKEAIVILRMLNNGGNSAFEIIDSYIKDQFKSVFLIEKIILLKSKEAQEVLLKLLPSSAVEKVIKLLFVKPPSKAYLVVDSTMPNKMPTISYLGNWSFPKVYITQSLNKKEKKQIIDELVKFEVDKLQAQNLYEEAILITDRGVDEWVSQKFNFYSGLVKGQKKNDILFFENGFVYNPKEQTVYLYSCQEARYKAPKSLFIVENNELKEILYPHNDLDFSILIFKIKDDYYAVLFDRQLANSLFVRLFFLDGIGLKYFRFMPFIEEKYEKDYMKVFEIVWD